MNAGRIETNGDCGWTTRGYLPHATDRHLFQHVTFRLADSLPAAVLTRLDRDLENVPQSRRTHGQRARIHALMDAGYGSCLLADPEIGRLVQDSLLRFDKVRYQLIAWVVMPNHVHILFRSLGEWSVAQAVASWKRFTGHRIASLRGGVVGGPPRRVWQREYWDRYIRSQRHFDSTIAYIHQNPVKAGLVSAAELWPWSSASGSRGPR